ncbi:MAG: exodeoxyribonuclease VII small subunit [Bacteroidia bacterium]|jgi:exodeoxyribonuclease VII small subunit|nr:exodeoxyribonuclease VII small subunit [Bacteroidia bacterium]
MENQTPPFSLEDQLTEIRRIIDTMQKGVSDFDRQVALFQRGNELIAGCRTYLDTAEMQVQQLIDGKLTSLD